MHTSPLAQPGQGDAGGMNVYIQNLTSALIRAGYQVLSFTRKSASTDTTVILDEATNSRVIPVTAGSLQLPKEALSGLTAQFANAMLPELERQAKYPVVLHSHYWLSGLAALDIAQRCGVPVVHTMHTLAAAKNSSAPGLEPRYRVERETFLGAKAQILTANTMAERDDLMHFAAVDAQRIVVAHPGVDHAVFTPNGPAVWPGKQRPGRPKILFAGRMQAFKGPHILIEALAMLRRGGVEQLPTIHFTGAVSGQPDYDVRARAFLLGVADLCSFSPPATPEMLATYMRAADVVAVPSVAESFGLVAMESQACGTPVLAHRAGGLITVVDDHITGRLLDSRAPSMWATALRSISECPDTWKSYGNAALRHAEQFSWTAMAETMAEVYASLA